MKKLLTILLAVACLSSSAWAEPVRLRFIKDDAEALQVRIDMIRHAKKEILVEYFSVWNDDQSVGIMALLIDAAKRGVKVKMLLDALSNSVPNAVLSTMMRHGVDGNGNNNLEVKVYNPISANLKNVVKRTHAKLLITDSDRVLTGGRNIGDKYFGLSDKRNYDDLDVLTEKHVALAATNDFMAVWNAKIVRTPRLFEYEIEKLDEVSCANEENHQNCENNRRGALLNLKKEEVRLEDKLERILDLKGRNELNVRNFDWFEGSQLGSNVTFVSHEPTKLASKESAHMTVAVLDILNKAKRDIVILSPYIIPTEDLFISLAKAMARGVNVKFLTNSVVSTDNLFAQAGYRKYREVLIRMGVELYEYTGPNTMHVKGLVVDEKVTVVGSYNLDPRSAYLNREVGIIIIEELGSNPVARELLKIEKELAQKARLVARGGRKLVEEEELKEVLTLKNSILLKSISFILPLIEHQL